MHCCQSFSKVIVKVTFTTLTINQTFKLLWRQPALRRLQEYVLVDFIGHKKGKTNITKRVYFQKLFGRTFMGS